MTSYTRNSVTLLRICAAGVLLAAKLRRSIAIA